ncbi:MAG: hypothetical protein H0U02_06265, partial [Rubrobacter sp.]|nr:hypothetical protein [Rubrobacter sp.]
MTVEGTNGPDRITIGVGRAGAIRVVANGTPAVYSGVTRLVVLGGDGDDLIRVRPRVQVSASVDGGEGDDRIEAMGSSASVSGGGGDDVL